jgi:hypothetical protein
MPARKGQGQWALGYREPLNPNERAKRDDDGLNVRRRIIDVYQHTGFAGIDPVDLRGRMRWYGLYTQRAPGIPGGRTAILEPQDLEDEYFMMRIRIDGGALRADQLAVIGEVAGPAFLGVERRQLVDEALRQRMASTGSSDHDGAVITDQTDRLANVDDRGHGM